MHGQSSDEQAYWALWQQSRDAEAGNSLVKRYMPLVSYHVQRISAGLPKNVSRDELRSLGLMGLYDALEKFDPTRDLKFDTYASFRIRGSIIDGLRKEDWLPRSTREKAKKIEAAAERLEQHLMRKATAAEIGKEVDLHEEEVQTVMSEHFFANVLSMDEQPQDQDEKDGATYILKDHRAVVPEEKVAKDELLSEMADAVSCLNEKEQLVISLFYKEELTLTEIGQVMGLSTSRISQIHTKAIFSLRHTLQKIM
ncbi:FliA/WhiG family RNA polymerase sigma factor [Bacillus infantis]|uniref:FliA/WhiG family RNA polymerase sigma factor n=1 Tax=Bacillus infantis TaxID=324767 RepID=UPI003CF00CA2